MTRNGFWRRSHNYHFNPPLSTPQDFSWWPS
jgi:hypothetical protein